MSPRIFTCTLPTPFLDILSKCSKNAGNWTTYVIFHFENRRSLFFNLNSTSTDSSESISSYNKYQSYLLDLLCFSCKPWCSNYRMCILKVEIIFETNFGGVLFIWRPSQIFIYFFLSKYPISCWIIFGSVGCHAISEMLNVIHGLLQA